MTSHSVYYLNVDQVWGSANYAWGELESVVKKVWKPLICRMVIGVYRSQHRWPHPAPALTSAGQTGWYLTYLPRWNGRLSWPNWPSKALKHHIIVNTQRKSSKHARFLLLRASQKWFQFSDLKLRSPYFAPHSNTNSSRHRRRAVRGRRPKPLCPPLN